LPFCGATTVRGDINIAGGIVPAPAAYFDIQRTWTRCLWYPFTRVCRYHHERHACTRVPCCTAGASLSRRTALRLKRGRNGWDAQHARSPATAVPHPSRDTLPEHDARLPFAAGCAGAPAFTLAHLYLPGPYACLLPSTSCAYIRHCLPDSTSFRYLLVMPSVTSRPQLDLCCPGAAFKRDKRAVYLLRQQPADAHLMTIGTAIRVISVRMDNYQLWNILPPRLA